MLPRYTKTEIIDRVYWMNNFRLLLGGSFFVILVIQNIFCVRLSENVFVLMLLGLGILFYSLLTYYYLRTQKISLNEIIFLSTFLGIVDLIVMTLFNYFSGGPQSPYVIAYVLFIALVPFWSPYSAYGPLIWALLTIGLYESMLILVSLGVLPLVQIDGGLIIDQQYLPKLCHVNGIVLPIVLFCISLCEVFIIQYLGKERLNLESALNRERDVERKYSAFTSIFWTLTHVFNLDVMLKDALEKMLAVLGLHSGLIVLMDKKKVVRVGANMGVPEEFLSALRSKKIKEISDVLDNVQGIFLGKEFIQKELVRKLVFRRKTVGFFILFSHGEGLNITHDLEKMLEAVADEMAAAVYYGRLVRKVRER
ncbi:MAG: hypothetical protein JW782_03540 [Candidatus Saganbacteria bacterium]|nr:hypothetical protein [Candidatus Saganbacteria bacterium]